MASTFNKEITRSIAQSASRFVAIVVISLLGAGFYAGLRMSAPDMRVSGDEFFDGTNLYDISVVTTLGVDDDMVESLRAIEGVGAVMPAHQAHATVRVGESSRAACIESLPLEAARASDTSDGVHAVSSDDDYLNRPILINGAWPEAVDECVVAADAAAELGIALGDVLPLEKTTGDLDDTFAQKEFVVTGFVNSPTYASSANLGPTSLATGSLDLYAYCDAEAFADDLPYAVAYLAVPAAKDEQWDGEAYDQTVHEVRARIELEAPALADARRQAVKDDLHHEVMGVFQELAVSLDWADDIETPEVFVLDRSKNVGCASLSSDSDGITQIALFLPFMFFLVAALVSLTSMTRMVDEERMAIGTHKALGYGKARITSKYLIYGMLASGIGSVVGVVALGKLLPWFILTSYGVSYAIPVYATPIDAGIAVRAIGLSVGITAIATWGAAAASLRAKPAELMLPRAPKAGKRIILERIRPLWNAMTFSHKVTARNLLRYKRRFFMAVAGVAGCTALLMVGFGLRDAIGGIVANQYEELVNYDMAVRVEEKISPDNRDAVDALLASGAVESSVSVDDFNLIAEGAGDDMRIEVVVPSDAREFERFVQLRDRQTHDPIALEDGGIVLTEKASEVLEAFPGDEVVLYDENDVGDKTGDGHAFTVTGVTENYLGHFAYLTPNTYERAFDEKPWYGLSYVKLADGADRASFGNELLAIDGVSTVSFVSDKISTYEDMLDVMNKLIYVIMALSAALAFVVLYNLTHINIAERVREIATLKVLGFTRGEVNAYIFREIVVMSLIGALVGCVGGVPLTFYIARAAETADMMFGRTIEPASFVLSFVLTLAFTGIVLFSMRRKLFAVNMVESLKSVE